MLNPSKFSAAGHPQSSLLSDSSYYVNLMARSVVIGSLSTIFGIETQAVHEGVL